MFVCALLESIAKAFFCGIARFSLQFLPFLNRHKYSHFDATPCDHLWTILEHNVQQLA
jgi:hypothetical protein